MARLMDIFADKTVLIAGAATDLVWRLLPQLESARARVILLDEDEDELMSMARRAPTLLEPLPVEKMEAETVKVVGKIWGDEPIDVLIDALALSECCEGADVPFTSKALMSAFEPALSTADGCVVSIVPKPFHSMDATAKMVEAACLQMAATLAEKWGPQRVTFNVVRPAPGASANALAKAVDIAARAGWNNFTGVHIPVRAASR
ncbi:hypothetical protein TA5114_02938 [Cognatishimia activa]|uniref:Uncharacterized protein n=2 Tax=Cognatishimia activa TaxID=1715691 RepID=A0A0P1IUA3_9RHOB|nr:hypothetical protein TA5113_03065 [Cognatishimia activa]CUK27117.1 hypothetical protein TA5114_02938 [Cognatishimia activa]